MVSSSLVITLFSNAVKCLSLAKLLALNGNSVYGRNISAYPLESKSNSKKSLVKFKPPSNENSSGKSPLFIEANSLLD